MTDLEKLHSIDDRVNKVLRRLTNATARLILEIRTHHRHNEKLDVFRSFVTQLEHTADNLDQLAEMNRAHEASSVHQISKPSVARPSGSGEEPTKP